MDKQYGYVWMIVKGIGLVVYDFNQTPLMIQMMSMHLLLRLMEMVRFQVHVNTVAIDLDGVIRIGTDNGPVQFYSSYPIFNESNYNAQRILIEDNGTIQYLLESQIINDIEIDGANGNG